MTAVSTSVSPPAFCEGIQHFAQPKPEFEKYGQAAAIESGQVAIATPSDPAAVYQTLFGCRCLALPYFAHYG